MPGKHFDLPPLDQLEAFEAAARHLSFTRAAEELSLTQSAVSRQIAAIEQRLDVVLFRRMHRALALTDEGRLLQTTVADVLRQLHRVSAELRRAPRVRSVIVSTTPGLAGLWLIPRLARFTAQEPGVDVRISANNRLVDLGREGVDVAVRYCPTVPGAGPGAELLFRETVVPVCSPSLLADPGRPLRAPEDLRHHVLLHTDVDLATAALEWPMWMRAMGIAGLEPAGSLHFSQYDQLVQAAIAGQGVALGRSPIVDDLITEGRLAVPFEPRLASARGYYLLVGRGAADRPDVRAFTAWLCEEAGASRV